MKSETRRGVDSVFFGCVAVAGFDGGPCGVLAGGAFQRFGGSTVKQL